LKTTIFPLIFVETFKPLKTELLLNPSMPYKNMHPFNKAFWLEIWQLYQGKTKEEQISTFDRAELD